VRQLLYVLVAALPLCACGESGTPPDALTHLTPADVSVNDAAAVVTNDTVDAPYSTSAADEESSPPGSATVAADIERPTISRSVRPTRHVSEPAPAPNREAEPEPEPEPEPDLPALEPELQVELEPEPLGDASPT
jgi:hypothetical protein